MGGLIAYADLSVYRRRKLEPKKVESICLDVKDTNNTRFIVCACYRSPSKCKCKVSHFISSLSSAIELMYRSRNEILLLRDFNMECGFLSDLRNVPWHTSFVYDNADDVWDWDHWSKLCKEVLDKHASLKEKQIRSEQLPWISPEILCEISHRNRLYKNTELKPNIIRLRNL